MLRRDYHGTRVAREAKPEREARLVKAVCLFGPTKRAKEVNQAKVRS